MEISKESILKAIEKIDSNPNLQKGRTSSTYDLVYNNRKYPPILVLSEANKVNGGKEVYLEDFKNGTSEAFKYLTDFGFEIVKKHESYYDELLKFLQQSKTDELKISNYKKGFEGLKVKVSFGMGVPANIPWISFLRDGISTNDGIYPVYLYFKKEKLLILSYGISETNIPKYEWPIINPTTINKFFVQKYTSTPYRYGKSYIFKSYSVDNLPQKEIIDKDLHELINFYKSLSLEEKNTRLTQPEIKLQNSLTFEETNMSSLQIDFNYKSFHKKTEAAGLIFSEKMVARFIASLCSKPFVICSGLSGSGKTKLAQAFVHWICESEEQYKIIPVGADWTNREPLLGYPNAIESEKYVAPENGALELILAAITNKKKPYFLILDEMNLSHVERYFADFLSAMESKEPIPLHKIEGLEKITTTLTLPKNLFIIGTVNIDETTYMFSPKVLDRANTIEFRIDEDDLKNYFQNTAELNMDVLKGEGLEMASSFLEMATSPTVKDMSIHKEILIYFFSELKKSGAEFGYRTTHEIGRLIKKLEELDIKGDDLMDIAIMQKLLPKLHGSRNKLTKVLIKLGELCLVDLSDCKANYFDKTEEINFKEDDNIKYKLSFEKIVRMYKNALDNGFASYAEA
jgi:5-methylcytosine-specific restriction protein B